MTMGIAERLKAFKSYASGGSKAGDVYRLVIEISNACNLKCTMCPRSMMQRPIQFMDASTFESLISDNRETLEFVSLNGYGEPLLHPEIFNFLAVCRKYGVRTGISTNCSTLNEKKAKALLENPPDIITLAIDGVSAEDYEKVRVGAVFETVTENVSRFLAICADYKHPMYIILQCIYMTETKHQISSFRNLFAGQKYDAIRIRQLTYSGAIRDDADYRNRTCACYWLWNEPMVLADGTLVPCCQDVNGELALGSIKNHSLNELWNQHIVQMLRDKHASGQRNAISICSDCNMYQPSPPLMIGATVFNTSQINVLVPSVESVISKFRYRG
jgi:radical SAM protein with 4Fe4S-binding SPASM domain